ncbi:MAG: NADH:flavin oxidoreductase [Thermovirga sp.]|nr:NADH:flavin oxidoreductase [Thermovirga sp.]
MSKVLWQPIQVGPIELKNRLVSAPIATSTSTKDGLPTADTLDINEKIAKSGVALSIVEHHAVHKEGRTRLRQLLLDRDEVVSYQQRLTDLYSNNDCNVIVQVNHAGSLVQDEDMLVDDWAPIAPSALRHPCCALYVMPRPIKLEEMPDLVELYAQASLRAVKAGYRGVEIHACHGYLIGQFLSPLTNQRKDKYGGEIKNRARFLFEVYEAVRDTLSDEYVVAVRLGAADSLPNEEPKGLTIDESKWVAKELSAMGVDLLDISGNLCGYDGEGSAYFADYVAAIKGVVGNTPVVCTGGITEPTTAEALLEKGVCDLVGLGRALRKNYKIVHVWEESHADFYKR